MVWKSKSKVHLVIRMRKNDYLTINLWRRYVAELRRQKENFPCSRLPMQKNPKKIAFNNKSFAHIYVLADLNSMGTVLHIDPVILVVP